MKITPEGREGAALPRVRVCPAVRASLSTRAKEGERENINILSIYQFVSELLFSLSNFK